jgi:hypothetical protein
MADRLQWDLAQPPPFPAVCEAEFDGVGNKDVSFQISVGVDTDTTEPRRAKVLV